MRKETAFVGERNARGLASAVETLMAEVGELKVMVAAQNRDIAALKQERAASEAENLQDKIARLSSGPTV